jgi:large subunit ribosomal protein L18e
METEICKLEGKFTQNIFLQLPHPYRFLARHTDTSFTKVPLHHLFLSKMNRAPLSLSPIVKETSNTVDLSDKIIVSDGTITDNIRLTEVPELTINAAKDCILNAGGEVTMTSSSCRHLLVLTVLLHSKKTTGRQANTWTRKESLHNIGGM